MDHHKEMCCLCLSALNASFRDLFLKNEDGLSQFDKISSTLSQLSNVLKENSNIIYKVCDKCWDTIETMYHFNETCLNNVGIYLSYQRTVKTETEIEQCNLLYESNNDRQLIPDEFCSGSKLKDPIDIFVKQEVEFVSISTDINKFHEEFEEKFEIEEYVSHMNCDRDNKPKNLNNENMENTLNPSTSEDINISKNITEESSLTQEHFYQNPIFGECIQQNEPISQETTKNEKSCVLCRKNFKHTYLLKKHMRCHIDVRFFKCETCNKSFNQKSKTVHMHTHTNRPSHKCKICEKSFSTKNNLTVHYISHTNERPFSCDQCDKRFKLKGHLVEHKIVHAGVKPYECYLCKRAFTTKSNLSKHLRNQHITETENNKKAEVS